MSRIAVPAAIAAVCILTGSTFSNRADASEGFCASRAYDRIGEPVRHFSLHSWPPDPDLKKYYPKYKLALTKEAMEFGLDSSNESFVLQEKLSLARYSQLGFSKKGTFPVVALAVCQFGKESKNICRNAIYYFYGRVVDSGGVEEILNDILMRPVPSSVESCMFPGEDDWLQVTPGRK